MTGNQSRRSFLQIGAAGLATLGTAGHVKATAAAGKKSKALTLGMCSYTFRKFPLEQALAMTRRCGVDKIAFKSMHLPLDSSPEQIAQVIEKTKAAGLEAYGCGVVYMNTEAEVQQAFDYAKAAGHEDHHRGAEARAPRCDRGASQAVRYPRGDSQPWTERQGVPDPRECLREDQRPGSENGALH